MARKERGKYKTKKEKQSKEVLKWERDYKKKKRKQFTKYEIVWTTWIKYYFFYIKINLYYSAVNSGTSP